MTYGLIPPSTPPYQPHNDRRRQSGSTFRERFRDFTTNPIPMPVWLWNSFMLLLYFGLAVFILYAGVVALALIFTLLRMLF